MLIQFDYFYCCSISFAFAVLISADNNDCFPYNNRYRQSGGPGNLLKFAKQPASYCSPTSSSMRQTAKCSSKEGAAEIVWHVYDLDSEQQLSINIASSFSISYNKTTPPLSTLTLSCRNRSVCSFKVWCQLISASQSIRSTSATIRLGNNNIGTCGKFSRQLAIAPRPLFKVIKAEPLSKVILPCLTIATNRSQPASSIFSTSWYFNGSLLPLKNGDADGVFNVDRRLVAEFFVWSNLTIFHVNAKHAGYYQCFVNGEQSGFNVIRLEIESNKFNEENYSLTAPKIFDVGFQDDKWLQVSFSEPSLISQSLDEPIQTLPVRKIAIGVIRHRRFSEQTVDANQKCLGELGPGATTDFVNAYLVTRSDGAMLTVVFDQLPESFFVDELLCSQTYSYSIFVKALASHQAMTATSDLAELPYFSSASINDEGNNSNSPRQLNLEIFEQKSGSSFICLHQNSAIDSLPEIEFGRFFTPATWSQILPKEPVQVIEDCSCLEPRTHSTENVQIQMENLTHVPFAINGLISATDYCIKVSSDCYSYRTPETVSVLSYERSRNSIEVTWQLPMCRSLGVGSAGCYLTLKRIRISSNNNATTESIRRLQKRVTRCTGRAIFANLTQVNDTHEIVITCNKIDLASRPIPPTLRIFGLSAVVVSLAKLLLRWESNGINQREITPSFKFYACPDSLQLDKKAPNVEEEQFLACLGCHLLKTVKVTNVSPTSHYAEIYDFDHNVRTMRIVISADAGYEDAINLGILGNITVELDDSATDRFRPKFVSVTETVDDDDVIAWNVTWSPPELAALGFVPTSFQITATPFDNWQNGQVEAAGTLKLRTLNAALPYLFIGNLSELIYEKLLLSHFDSTVSCLKIPADEYLVQINPILTIIWDGNAQQKIDFLGSASAPILHSTSRLQSVITARYKVHLQSAVGSLIHDNNSDSQDEESNKNYGIKPVLVLASLGTVTFAICLVLFVPYFNKR